MELLLGDLLEFMDKKFPNEVFYHELFNYFSLEIIQESYDKGFIANTHGGKGRGIMGHGIGEGLVITSDGFLALNQIRIKKATEELNKSIKGFDKSSEKYSKITIRLTRWIIGLTIILGIIALIQLVLLFTQR